MDEEKSSREGMKRMERIKMRFGKDGENKLRVMFFITNVIAN